jgi:hypothetical protein
MNKTPATLQLQVLTFLKPAMPKEYISAAFTIFSYAAKPARTDIGTLTKACARR